MMPVLVLRRTRLSPARILWAALAVVLAAVPLAGHEEGVIRLASPTGTPGQVIEIEGEKLPRSTALTLELRGALASYPLGKVDSDETGAFTARLSLPDETRPGRYRLMALAPDGDAVGRVDLVVMAGPSAAIEPAGPSEPVHVTDAMMDLPVTRSAAEWIAIVAFVFGAAGAGLLLLRGGAPRGEG